eukprot:TRINITY_DN89158_c0_g1_i1.p1 TRINITY_DN89158_c0_g1~~TRINITY_DN89158_c0_g1_i1.p1  ORF type:complete len:292 (-),score=37.49 TRINITY_DN89158_c0_g1_i1:318-1193(-)
MGSAASADIQASLHTASAGDVQILLKGLSEASRNRLSSALAREDDLRKFSNSGDAGDAAISVVTGSGDEVCRVSKRSVRIGLDLKHRINESEGTPVMQQRLVVDGDVLADDQDIPGLEEAGDLLVSLTRMPPCTPVTIKGGQGNYVGVDNAGTIRPGPRFVWHMAQAGEGMYTFQAAEGPHQGKYVSALRGAPYSSESKLEATGFADLWAIDTGGADIFYGWVRCGPFSMGVRDATRTTETKDGELDIYWRWQPNHYHLASKKRGHYQGDEAFFISVEGGDGHVPAVQRGD